MKKTIEAIITLVLYSIIILGISGAFILNDLIIGISFILLGFFGIIILKYFKIQLSSIFPDIIFGIIDNGVLVFAAILGGTYAGVAGAIIGGAAGNTITDGIGGLFEGHFSEQLRNKKINDERNAVSTMLGKMIGCLWGAGAGLLLIKVIIFTFTFLF